MTLSVRAFTLAALLSTAAIPAFAETPDDQLVVGFSMTNVLTLDPAAITGREPVQILANVYDGLVSLDAKDRAKVNPDLAESWEVAADGNSITFHLREGATFASGNPVTAEDVIWSLNRLMTLNLAQASFLKTHGFSADNAAASFTAPDAKTVVVTLPKPLDPDVIVQTLGIVGPGSVLDSKLVMENEKDGDLGAAWLNSNSAGSGMFGFEGWKANDRVILTRNDAFWGEPSAMKRIIMRHIPESQNQRLMLEKGDIDIGFSLAGPDLKALSEEEGVEVISQPGSGFYYLAVSMKDERFANPKVREALRYLIDYQGINAAIMPYYGQEHQRPIATGFLGELPDPGYTLDVEKAKALLAEAGHPDGFETSMTIASSFPAQMAMAPIIQANLAAAGIKAKIGTMEIPRYWDEVWSTSNFDITSMYWLSPLADPDDFLTNNYKCGMAINVQKYCNKQMDELLEQAKAAATEAERKELYKQVTQLSLDDMGQVPLVNGWLLIAHSNKLQNTSRCARAS
jgi:peptide/nickel transport system substrate-binding protein